MADVYDPRKNIDARSATSPWARFDAWRSDPFFSRRNTFKHMFPGLGIATVAFLFYCGAEWILERNKVGDNSHHSVTAATNNGSNGHDGGH